MLRDMTLASLAIAMLSAAYAAPLEFLGTPCTGSFCDNGMKCLSPSGENCTRDGWRVGAPCTYGGGETDPYFTGFTGQSFYLSAEAGNVYNLFSEQSHIVNALFVATEMPQESENQISTVSGSRNSSFIGALALRHGSTSVEISSDREGEISVKINGTELDLGSEDHAFDSTLELPSNVSITIDKHPYLYTSTLVTVTTELLAVTVFPERFHEDTGNVDRGHLNLQMTLKVSSETPPCTHGILGITTRKYVTSNARAFHVSTRVNRFRKTGVSSNPTPNLTGFSTVQDAFPGEPREYIVPSLFSPDFAYDLFNKPASSVCASSTATPADGIASSRKLLIGNRPQILKNGRLEASFGVQRLQQLAEQ